MAETELDWSERINSLPEGWLRAMGIRISRATADEVTCEWDVDQRHHQGYGIVHGGVYCGVVEGLASIGAAVFANRNGQGVVGLENQTSFIRAVREGRLHGRATPLTRGRRSQVWECGIWDQEERLIATGRVRLLCIDPEQPLAGRQPGRRLESQLGDHTSAPTHTPG